MQTQMPPWNRALIVVGILAGYALFAAITGRTSLAGESLNETIVLCAIATVCCAASVALVHFVAVLLGRIAR